MASILMRPTMALSALLTTSFALVIAYGCLAAAADGSAAVSPSSTTPTEEVFLQVPNPDSARTNLRYITSQPHVAGTHGDFLMADFVAQKFRQAGIPHVSMFHLDVLLNYPESAPRVRLLSKTTQKVLYSARLSEDVEAFDDTSDTAWRNHTFHGYSPPGNVTGPLVYANYGRPADYDALEQVAGINLTGKVVLVRYGKCFRGLKVMNAQSRGAIAVIIYSDPADDGFGVGPVYPDGPWRPPSGVQRGSVQFISKCPGDPARLDSRYNQSSGSDTVVQERCGVKNYTELIPRIPSVPMSYQDALPLLKQLGGMEARQVGGNDYVGGFSNITYRVGPTKDDTVVQVVVNNYETVATIPNVIAHVPGTLEPEQDMPVLLGNHRDAWVYGAADPNSGTAALLEVAAGLGALMRTAGWKPKRSIYLLSWSGEEYSLLGSTGWAELNAHEPFLQRAVAYLNVDTVVSGEWLKSAATPSLGTLWNQVLDDLMMSTTSEQFSAPKFANGPAGDLIDGNTNWILNHPEQKILGSGSDYTAFLDHLGITSLDFSFHKQLAQYGQYHSIYDSFAWMDAYGGSDHVPRSAFELMALAARIWGLLALRLADATVLPLDHVVQGEALTHYVDAIAQQDSAGLLDLKLLTQAVGLYQHAATALHQQCGLSPNSKKGGPLLQSLEENHDDDVGIHQCNEKLGLTERKFLTQAGLPDRPWFKHVLQAPGLNLGYAAESFPGVQYALEKGNWTLAQEQVNVAAARILDAAGFLHPSSSSSPTAADNGDLLLQKQA